MGKGCVNRKLLILTHLLVFVLWTPFKSYGLEGVLGNFSLPLFSDEGTQIGVVNGESAKFLDENTVGIIKAEGEISNPSFPNPWKLKTPQCVFKKNEQRIIGEQRSSLETLGFAIEGDGLEWMLDKGRITFFKNVTVDLNKMLFSTKKL